MLKALPIIFLILYLNIWLRILCPYLEDGFNDKYTVPVNLAIQNSSELECLDISYLKDPTENMSGKSDGQYPPIPNGTNVKEVIAIVEESIISIIRFVSLSKESDIIQNEEFFSEFLFTPPEPPPKA